MAGPRRWTRLARERIQSCRVFDVHRLHARSPRTGIQHDFFGIDCADWVNVVPFTPHGEVVMVRQYCHGADRVAFEVPGGSVDPGEAAAREGDHALVVAALCRFDLRAAVGGEPG